MALFIDKLRSNKNAQVTIDALGNSKGVYIKGFIMEDFQFGGRNSFNSAMEAILGASQVIADVNAGLRMGTSLLNRGGAYISSRTFSGGDSVMSWVMSDRPRFSLPLLFLAVNNADDPRQTMRDLMAFVYPSGDPNSFLTAPLGYSANFFSYGDSGCCAVSVGKWFRTPRLFVVKQVMMTISQRTDRAGVPLYVGAAIELEAQRTMTAEEVRRFFV